MKDGILLLGLGNTLMGDDGAGVRVVERFLAEGEVAGVRAEIAGSDSLILGDLFRGEREIWIVDAFVAGAPPGTIHRVEEQALLALPQGHESAHRLGLPECLRWLRHTYPALREVKLRFVGIEPEWVGPTPHLSPPVDRAAALLARELRFTLEMHPAGGIR